MSEDVIAKLTRFTPTAGFDRDELLFRAGRASAPSTRWWRVAAGLLAVTQVGTLAAWMLHIQSAPPITVPAAVEPIAVEPEAEPVEPPARNSYLILSRIDPDEPYRPAGTDAATPTKPRPPLTAGWRGGPID